MFRRLCLALSPVLLCGAAAGSQPEPNVAHERLGELAREIREFREVTGDLPSSLEGVDGIASTPALLEDPWGFPVFYLRVAGGFWLMSWGADGAPGGEGDAADLVHIAK